MAEDFLDDDLRTFIAEHIVSVEQLEVLLLLSSSSSDSWTVDQVFKVIQSNPASLSTRLSQLHEIGFLRLDAEGRYCYKPSEHLDEQVTRLGLAYRQSRVKVLEAIFSHSMDQARSFAASFRIEKK